MKARKFLAAVLCGVLACALCSCGNVRTGAGIEEDVDPARTQLYVSNFNGGYGDKWLRNLKAQFEEQHKDDEIEAGKKGVQVLIDNAKTSGAGLLNTIKGSSTQVFFSESVNYREFVSQRLILDITDMVKQPLTAYGENKSIYDKFNDVQKKYLAVNDRIYAIPHYEGFNGITVDVDLFDNKKLFMGKDGQFKYTSDDADLLSAGPDGNADTAYDNGLPATYAQFYDLCATMVKRGVTPITWSGDHQFYAKDLVVAMAADDNGYKETTLGFSFDGSTSENLIDLSTLTADGTYTTQSGKIDAEHGYDIMRQEGYYNALKFLHTVIDNKWYSGTSFTDGQSQTDTQDDFLLSSKDSSLKPIAMLVEGCWWENEASGTFDRMSSYPNAGKFDRRFRFIPFPKSSSDKVGTQGQTLVENIMAYGFINANIDEKYKALALEFLRFCNTDSALKDFTVTTNTTKALQYEMSGEDLDKCTYYGRSLYERKTSAGTQVVYPLSDSPLYNENYSTLAMTYRITYGEYLFPSTAFKEHRLTAEKYITDLCGSLRNSWGTKYGKYF